MRRLGLPRAFYAAKAEPISLPRRSPRARRAPFDRRLRLEGLEGRLLLATDFGDAPLPYQTTLAENGARHEAIGPRLGATRDTEADGVHSAAADGDGEDGVTFGAIQVGQLGATVTVNVQGGAARLDAWIDFDSDGAWGGPLEQIANNVAVVNGDNTLTFDVPSWAADGQSFGRFRLSTAGNLGVRGAAADGEVEDYAVTLAPPAAASGIFGAQNPISTIALGASSVFAADIDGDGDTDVLSASNADDKIAWYENNGSQTFTTHTISTAANGAQSVFAADVDGDGDTDVLSASAFDDKIAWHENDGTPAVGAWPVFFIISIAADSALNVFAADVDGDGDTDVLSASQLDDTIAWYENDGTPAVGPWTLHTISTVANGARAVLTADVDGDGDTDVLSASGLDDKLAWYENDGGQTFTERLISTAANLPTSLFVADVDGDGDTDVLSASSEDDKIAWYENDGSPADGGFTAHTISTAADRASSVFAADVDGDGDTDVLSASQLDDKIAWYENDGGPGAPGFTERPISTAAGQARAVFAADVDGDGDLDVLSASYFPSKIAWYENFAFDFGDAPPPYPTTLAEDGARHETKGPRLGAARDSEDDGQASLAADGDGADDDGVSFGVIRVGQLAVTATVNVQNAPAGAKLDAWIDFDADGAWGGPLEQIANNVALVAGNNTVTFDVPSTAADGQTFARFRLSTAGNLGVRGAAADGEVEDYDVMIAPPTAARGVFGFQNTITTAAQQALVVSAADIDGDGDMDVLSASRTDRELAWYENNGGQVFTSRTISITPLSPTALLPVDIDGDGDTDVLASYYNDKVAWFENDGTPAVGAWTARTVSTAASIPFGVYAADMDGDGDIDVLSASIGDNKIAWYENNGSPGAPGFTAHTISTDAQSARGVWAADVDGDGDMDALSASNYDNKIAWYENSGSQTFTERPISTTATGAHSVVTSDIDGDGDLDVASAADAGIAWYENDGSPSAPGFTAHTISTDVDFARIVFAGDIDGDADTDILAASSAIGDSKVVWFENNGSPSAPGFTARTISTAVPSARGVHAADVDGDGDMDVLSASYSDNRIAWFQQQPGMDWGDAPAPYPTTLAANGPRHPAVGPQLGALRDFELDGQPSAGADADGADEDGVTFGAIQVGQLGATATVHVQNAPPGGAKLDAWIDFNADGAWGGPLEQIANSVAVAGGDNTITFDVPSWAHDGQTFARFRLSSAGDRGMRGGALDGEVEDYALSISPPEAAAGDFSVQRAIANTSNADISAADIDRDGDIDVLATLSSGDLMGWFENDGNQNFTGHTITTAVDEPISVVAADVDGDGDIDVLSASRRDNKIAWYENDGSQSFTARTISTTASSARCVFAADMDGDGDTDVLSASYYDDKIAWYENDGTPADGGFTERPISTAADGARSVFAADVDGDGDMDVLSASHDPFDDKIAWYENNGGPGVPAFTERTISTAADGANTVFAADVDGDGDTDVLSASVFDDTIAWYENNGAQVFTERIITSTADAARSVFAADIDGDGDTDVVSASSADDTVAWHENDGAEVFTERPISTTAGTARGIFVADVNGDGDLDVIASQPGSFGPRIVWFDQLDEAGQDWGDAPAPYPTLLAADGARHDAKGPRLGNARDVDADGQPTAAADGDGADDDAVTFSPMLVGHTGSRATVNVQLVATTARLDAWIDFDGDGVWNTPLEQVADSLSVVNGLNSINVDVPGFAAAGQTFARFRLSTAGDLDVTGAAADGEVEDYQVTIAPAGIFGSRITISTAANGPQSVFAADVDGDGDMDALSASYYDAEIAWYENDGSQNFTARTISSTAVLARSVFAADVDGDGDMDVLSASSFEQQLENEIAWYENDGNENFTAHTISNAARGARSVFVADVDGDGDNDVLSASTYDDMIAWYENDGSQSFTRRPISFAADGARSVFAADVDGDGDMDVLSASLIDDTIAWYENNGSQVFTERLISTTANGAFSVFAADVDGDGDMDVLSASLLDDKIAWYENDGNQTFTARTISTTADGALAVVAEDVDGDGDMDVLSASTYDDKIAWYENDGSQAFTEHPIGTGDSVFAADVDRDGETDVLAGSFTDDRIAWFENLGSPGLVCDLNRDLRVDRADAAILARNYGITTGAAADHGDLDGDGAVSLKDLALCQANFGAVAPSPPDAAAPAAVSVSAASTSRVAAPLAATRRRVDRDTAVDRVMTSQEALSIVPTGPRILRARRGAIIEGSASATWQQR